MLARKEEKPLIAIFNTSIDFVEVLGDVLESEGYRTVTEIVSYLRRGSVSLQDVFKGEKPTVIIYDVGLPYEENWQFLQKLKTAKIIIGTRIIVTTTNKSALERLIGQDSHAFEITGVIGKPFDLDYLLDAVRIAVSEVEKENKLVYKQERHV